jgi:hypothetical protein
MSFSDSAYPNYLVWTPSTFEWRGQAAAPEVTDPPYLYLALTGGGKRNYKLGDGCTMPYDTTVYCRLQFEAGIERPQEPEVPPTLPTFGAIDLCIIQDVTGSMGGAIGSLKTQLSQVVQEVVAASGGDYRLALVSAGDEVRVNVPFSPSNIAVLEEKLSVLNAFDGLESTTEALRAVLHSLPGGPRDGGVQVGDFVPFREDARRIVVIVTDTMPQRFRLTEYNEFTPGVDDVAIAELVQEAADAGIRICSIFVPTGGIEVYQSGYVGTERNVASIMLSYADVTGGLYFRSRSDGSDVAAALLDVIRTGGGDIPEPSPVDATSGFARPLPCCRDARCSEGSSGDGGGGPTIIDEGPPDPGQGTNCSYYFDTLASTVYKKISGTWVLIAGVGTDSLALSGHGLPAAASFEGAYYIDLDAPAAWVYIDAQWVNVRDIACNSGPGTEIDPDDYTDEEKNGSNDGPTHDAPGEQSPDNGGGYGDPNCGTIVLRNNVPLYRPARRVGILRVPEVGESAIGIRGIRIDAKNESAMRAAVASLAGLWAAPDAEVFVEKKPLQFLTASEKTQLSKANVPLPFARDFYFASPVRFASIVWVVRALDARPEEWRVTVLE